MRGQCEGCKRYDEIDRAHIKTVGSGATWEPWEWLYLCRVCHDSSGSGGWRKYLNRYPHVEEIFKNKGWEIIFFQGRWQLRRI